MSDAVSETAKWVREAIARKKAEEAEGIGAIPFVFSPTEVYLMPSEAVLFYEDIEATRARLAKAFAAP